jgi:hypothetical protein
MKTRKLLEKLKAFFNADLRERHEKEDSLREILDKLAAKERKYERQLEEEKDSGKRRELEKKLHLIRNQRRKGLDLLGRR